VILGGGGTTISRSATAAFRIIHVAAGGTLTLTGVTVANGSGLFGGGILDEGTLALRNDRLTGNTAALGGGGLAVFGGHATATVSSSELAGNSTTGLGGSTANGGGGLAVFSGHATVSSSVLTGNQTTGLGGGILDEGTLALRIVRLAGNTALNGGGLGVGKGSQAAVSFSSLSGNAATGVGGGAIDNQGQLAVDHSALAGNTANVNGGGLNTEGPGTSRISSTVVARNRAGGLGGGISNIGTTLLTGDRVVFNRGFGGGGISNNLNGTVSLRFTLVAFNSPDNCHPSGTIPGCRN
jgi:hypothetical protein